MAQEQEAESGRLEEVVVTARKFEESIQDVPVAVTAVSAEMIESLGIQSLADISKMTAGLVFDAENGRGSNRPVIRGQANILGFSGVSYFIDGVYITGSIDSYDLNDVERIEVAKGPQSALYGRNTYSGAINIITRSPSADPGGRVKLEIAQDNQYEISAALRGGSETISGGIAVRYFKLGSPFINTWDGSDIGVQDNQSISGVLEFNPSDRLRIRARAYYAERDDGQPAISTTTPADNNCFPDNGSLYGGVGRYLCGVVDVRPINTDWPVQAPETEDSDEDLQLSLLIDYEINDAWSLTSITGYNDNTGVFVIDGDYSDESFHASNFTPNGFPLGFPFPTVWGYVTGITDFTFATGSDIEDFSQELRFEYVGDGLRALFGAYYFDQERTTRDIRQVSADQQALADANYTAEFLRMQGVCAANPFCIAMIPLSATGSTVVVPRDVNKLDIRNTALFGLVSFDINDAWTITAEGRWQEEKITQNVTIQDLGGTPDIQPEASATFDKFLPRVTLDWQVSDNNMLYALFAQGTKPGGFNSAVAIESGLPTFDEEEVDSFEIGSKNMFMDGSVVANFAMFMNDIDGYQLSQLARSGQNSTTATVNAGDAEIFGLEAEIMARLSDEVTLTFNYAWADTEFVSGRDQNQGVLNDVADDGLVNCSTGFEYPEIGGSCSTTSNPPVFGSIVGKRIPRTAEHQLYFDLEYRTPMSNGWEWYMGANYSFESSKYSQVHNLAKTGNTSLINARVGFVNDNFSVVFWGRNLTGEDSTYNILRYAEPTGFRRTFTASARRDTYFGATAIYNW